MKLGAEYCPRTVVVKNIAGDLCDDRASQAMWLRSETSNEDLGREDSWAQVTLGETLDDRGRERLNRDHEAS